MTIANILIEKHNVISETKFQLKSGLLILYRKYVNTFAPLSRFYDKQLLQQQPVIAVSQTDLWNTTDNEHNWVLTAGKVHNLRLAAKRLNGIEVDAGKTFSFWKHIGNPDKFKGYVIGRELREGCIIPTIAGGLCQLSNALYDAALKAGFEIVERHRHTKVIKGSLAEKDRDATVKWNYIDLRFRSTHSFRIEVAIDTDQLSVQFRSAKKDQDNKVEAEQKTFTASKLNDCFSCGNFNCFKHPGTIAAPQQKGITAFILDEKWSEYENYINTMAGNKDVFILTAYKNKFIRNTDWVIGKNKNIKATNFAALQRAIRSKIAVKRKANSFSAKLALDERIAGSLAKHIPVNATHLVIAQTILPFLLEQGVLGGRTFDVLMNRLPVELLHRRLDETHRHYPESTTLNDFRAAQKLIDLENTALTKARQIITPHREIAGIFTNKTVKLEWNVPAIKNNILKKGKKVLFPASALGRKGAYEMRRLAKELNLQVVLHGHATENDHFWEGITTTFTGNDPFEGIGLVVYPTYIENQPRLLLKALALGIPIITTTASGLSPTENLTILPMGNYEKLKQAVMENLQNLI